MTLGIEFCRFQRPPGAIPSSMLGLESLTGALENFGVEDYLNGIVAFILYFLPNNFKNVFMVMLNALADHSCLASIAG